MRSCYVPQYLSSRTASAVADQEWGSAVSRSWRELKVFFFAALPVLCAFRTVERVQWLILEPIAVQQKIFGRMAAYPWQLRNADIAILPEVRMYWTFAEPNPPKPLPLCLPPDPFLGRSLLPSCSFTSKEGGYVGAEWGNGQFQISQVFTEPPLDEKAEPRND